MKPGVLISFVSLVLAPMNGMGQVADAGPDTTLCVDFYTMQGSPLPPGASGNWVLYSGCAAINDPILPNTQVVNLCVGVNVFGWAVNDSGTITMDQVVITVYDINAPMANAGPDQTVPVPPGTAVMDGSPYTWPQFCSWSVVAGSFSITDPTDPNTTVTGLLPGGNILRWTCYNGPCGDTFDEVVLNALVWTGLEGDEDPASNALAFDPGTQQVRVLRGAIVDALEVFDVQGHRIRQLGSSGDVRSWSMAEQPAGLYVARAIVDGHPQVLRFVVSR